MKISFEITLGENGKLTDFLREKKVKVQQMLDDHRTKADYMKWCEEQYDAGDVLIAEDTGEVSPTNGKSVLPVALRE